MHQDQNVRRDMKPRQISWGEINIGWNIISSGFIFFFRKLKKKEKTTKKCLKGGSNLRPN